LIQAASDVRIRVEGGLEACADAEFFGKFEHAAPGAVFAQDARRITGALPALLEGISNTRPADDAGLQLVLPGKVGATFEVPHQDAAPTLASSHTGILVESTQLGARAQEQIDPLARGRSPQATLLAAGNGLLDGDRKRR